MPSVPTSATILVTGASGFLGTYIVKSLLEKGFYVHGTVRSNKKGEELKEIFENHERLQYLLVPDIGEAGAFDEVVRDVDAVIHNATPVTLHSHDPKAVIGPAISGTVGILQSAKKFGRNVKRIAIVSSLAAVGSTATEGEYTYTDKDWDEGSVRHVEKEGSNAFPPAIYAASKVLAERAAWKFIEENRNSISFDVTTACPGWIFGPVLTTVAAPKDSSNGYFLSCLKPEKTGDAATKQEGTFVDVRDLAIVLAELLTKEEAGNERYLIGAVEFSWQDVYDALNADPAIPDVPVGNPGATKGRDYDKKCDQVKLQTVLGLRPEEIFRPLSETVRDLVKQVKANGEW